jgi:hypothetical protein
MRRRIEAKKSLWSRINDWELELVKSSIVEANAPKTANNEYKSHELRLNLGQLSPMI